MLQEISLVQEIVEDTAQEVSVTSNEEDLTPTFTSGDLLNLPDILDLDWLIGEDSRTQGVRGGEMSESFNEMLMNLNEVEPGNVGVNFQSKEAELARVNDSFTSTSNSSSHDNISSSYTAANLSTLNLTSSLSHPSTNNNHLSTVDSFLEDLGLGFLSSEEIEGKTEKGHYDNVLEFMERESSYIDARDIVRSPLNCSSPTTSSSGYESDFTGSLDDPLPFHDDINLFTMCEEEPLSELFPALY